MQNKNKQKQRPIHISSRMWLLAQKNGGLDSEYPGYPIIDWIHAVSAGTILGYWNWVEEQLDNKT